MSEFDNVHEQITDLHRQAEELAARARLHRLGSASYDLYIRRATAKVRQAARLRAQAGEG